MTRKDKFLKLLSDHNYTSINNFCIVNGLTQTNVNRRVKNESIKVELPILFQWANILHEPIEELLEIFYPDEMAENKNLSNL